MFYYGQRGKEEGTHLSSAAIFFSCQYLLQHNCRKGSLAYLTMRQRLQTAMCYQEHITTRISSNCWKNWLKKKIESIGRESKLHWVTLPIINKDNAIVITMVWNLYKGFQYRKDTTRILTKPQDMVKYSEEYLKWVDLNILTNF